MAKSLIASYKTWTPQGKINFWGAIASIISLAVSFSLGGLASPFLWLAVAFVAAFQIDRVFRSRRLTTLGNALPNIPPHVRGELLRLEYGNVVPSQITSEEWRLIKREQNLLWVSLALIAAIVIIAALVVWRSIHLANVDELRAKLDETSQQLDQSREKDQQLFVTAAEARGFAVAVDVQTPSELTRNLKTKLEQLVSDLRAKVGSSKLSDDDARRLRLADAQIAFVNGKFDEALSLANEVDAQALKAKTESVIESECKLLVLRGDIFFATEKWDKALVAYDRLCELRPKDMTPLNRKASCLYYLERLEEAHDVYEFIINKLIPPIQHDGIHGEIIASVYANEAGVLADLGELDGAFGLICSAIDMLEKIRQKSDSPTLQVALAKAIDRRAGIYADMGKFDAALRDYEREEKIVNVVGSKLLRVGLLHDRATVLVEFGQYDAALPIISEAIDGYTKLMEQDEFKSLGERRADSLVTRAICFSLQGKNSTALDDFNDAISTFRSFQSDTRPDVTIGLIRALHHRAELYDGMKSFSKALDDVEEADKFVRKFSKAQWSPEVVVVASQVEVACGNIATNAAQANPADGRRLTQKAEQYYSDAIEMLRYLSDKSQKVVYSEGLAQSLVSRAQTRFRLKKRKESHADAIEAYGLFKKLVTDGTRPQMRRGLADCAMNLGFLEGQNGNMDQAVALLSEGISIYREMIAEKKWVTLFDLADALQIRGRLHIKNGQSADAEKDIAEAAETLQTYASEHPNSDYHRQIDRLLALKAKLVAGETIDDPLGEAEALSIRN